MTKPLDWQDFLKQAGLPQDAACLHSPHQEQTLIRVSGSDAESFLHAQLSNTVTGLKEGEARFAAWCNAKGRVWTLVRYWKDDDGFILRMPADQVEATLKRMRMFVLRSDVQLEPMAWQIIQFLGPDAETQAKQIIEQTDGETFHIPLPAAWPLHEVWSPEPLNSDLPELPQELQTLPRILAGIPEVFADQREQWIPQMLNLDKLDGVDFSKGCYPGQEIVAKLHYKGGLKQRMFVCAIESANPAPAPGKEITDTDEKKVGNIVEAALSGNRCLFSAVLRLEASKDNLLISDKPITITDN